MGKVPASDVTLPRLKEGIAVGASEPTGTPNTLGEAADVNQLSISISSPSDFDISQGPSPTSTVKRAHRPGLFHPRGDIQLLCLIQYSALERAVASW